MTISYVIVIVDVLFQNCKVVHIDDGNLKRSVFIIL